MSRAKVLADFPTNIASGAIGSSVTGGAGLSGSTSLGAVTVGSLGSNVTGGAGLTSVPINYVKLGSVDASGANDVTFNSTYVTDVYDTFELHMFGVITSVTGPFQTLAFSYDNGTTFYSTIAFGAFHRQFNGNSFVYLGLGNTASGRDGISPYFGIAGGAATTHELGGIVRMRNLNKVNGDFAHFDSHCSYAHDATASYGTTSSGYMEMNSSGRINYIKFDYSNAGLITGHFSLYGIK